MTKLKLIDSDDDDKDDATTSNSLEINKNYAERYDNWRRLEELQKIKDKYGDDINDTSSSEEEPEWSDTEEMQFLRTLSALKEKDKSIYDQKSQFWSEIDNLKAAPRLKKKKPVEEKPMYLKDYERKLVLEKEGQIDESSDEDDRKDPNYFEQQEQIRKDLRNAVENVSDEDDDLLVPKVKTENEKVKEDNEFYSWMKSQDAKEISDEDSLKGLKKAWKDPNIDEEEKFLRDYILNKDFIPNEEDKGITIDDIQEIEEDEKLLDMQRNFEQKYNFRFEDPDQEFIKQYPRTVGESLRKTNMKRKEKREEYKERKEREKKERKQEIRELKKMKKAEIEKKLERLKRLAGDDIPINVDDLTGDFDPREYDKRMQQIFNEEYYGKGEEACNENLEKPVFTDSDDDSVKSDISDYDNFPIGSAHEERGMENDKSSTKASAKRHEENSEGAPLPGRNQSHRKRRRNSKFCEAVRREKPLFDPKEKTFEEYFNEYYALDYEDIIGDHLTRFKYRQVVPNDFGLSVGEILSADDRQLNAWASLKKATGYRSEHEELVELKRYKKKAADLKKKARIFSTDFGGKKSKKEAEQPPGRELVADIGSANGDVEKKNNNKEKVKTSTQVSQDRSAISQEKADVVKNVECGVPESSAESKKRKRKRKRKTTAPVVELPVGGISNDGPPKPKKRKLKRRGTIKKKQADVEVNIADSRLRAYGINPKKFKNKLKFGKKKSADTTEC